MDAANKEEARRCLFMARTAMQVGDLPKARRMADKSMRLCPTDECREFVKGVEEIGGAGGGGRAPSPERSRAGPSRRARREEARKEQGGGGGEGGKGREHSQEQADAVQRVLGCEDYYDILGVSRDASEAELKKQYKRLALQLHPDKNPAPQSDEAFKAVSNAYAILSDENKRRQYDQFGKEGLNPSMNGRQGHSHFEADISPEDLFRMFFGEGFGGGNMFVYNRPGTFRFRTHPYRREGRHTHESSPGVWVQLLQVLPIVLLVLLSLFTNLLYSAFQSPPVFSLDKTNDYHIERHTEQLRIPYYVQDSFRDEHPSVSSVKAVERNVIQEHLYHLQTQCQHENFYHRKPGQGRWCKKYLDFVRELKKSR